MKKYTLSFFLSLFLVCHVALAQDMFKKHRQTQARFVPAFGIQGGSIVGVHAQYYRGAVSATRTQSKAFFKQFAVDLRVGVEGYLPLMPTEYGGGKLRPGGIQTCLSGLYHFMNTGSGELSLYVGAGLQTGIRQYTKISPAQNTSGWNAGGVARLGTEILVKRLAFNRSREAYITLFLEGNLYSEFIQHSPYSFIGGEIGLRLNTWHW